jgi:hypothetical protein
MFVRLFFRVSVQKLNINTFVKSKVFSDDLACGSFGLIPPLSGM